MEIISTLKSIGGRLANAFQTAIHGDEYQRLHSRLERRKDLLGDEQADKDPKCREFERKMAEIEARNGLHSVL